MNLRRPAYFTQQTAFCTLHEDLEATAMSVDWSGKWVLLAGRRDIALQNLNYQNDNTQVLHKFHRNSKHEVSAAEWSISEYSQEYCAIATSQLIEVVTWKLGDPTLIHSLRAHTRVVTDIDWHSKIPHLLASCSVDTFTHLWDLRDPRKPILSLSAVCMSGATQVGFNRVSGNLIAAAHDGDLRIWDQRKGNSPIQYITAHLTRIHGINWSHEHETRLATASHDGTVKYFDINHPRKAEAIIEMSSPVWRARYTPFSNGIVTVNVPHLERGETSLLLWNNSRQSTPICSFVGHKDVVLDFSWRPKRGYDDGERELISWSRDQTLRIWKVTKQMQDMCSKDFFDRDSDTSQFEEFSHESSPGSPVNDPIVIPQSSCALLHEFSLLNTNIPHIDVQTRDALNRYAEVKITANGHIVMLHVTFPLGYPDKNVLPEFSYCSGTSLDSNLTSNLMKKLKATANERVKKGRPCLEQCLRALVTALKKSNTGSEKGHMRLQSPRLEGALSGALHDACVPFPRSSGARFGHVNMLVTFTCQINSARIELKPQNTTPRALSSLSGGYLGNVMGTKPILYAQRDVSTFTLYIDKVTRLRKTSQRPVPTRVVLYDISKMQSIQKYLAKDYAINASNKQRMCQHNQDVAKQFARSDLVQCWSIAETVASQLEQISLDGRTLIPIIKIFASNLIQSLMISALKNYDVQTAAMLCCAFGRHCMGSPGSHHYTSDLPMQRKSIDNSGLEFRYQILHTGTDPTTPSESTWSVITAVPNNEQTLMLPANLSHSSSSWKEPSNVSPYQSETLLPINKSYIYDRFKICYADILNRWQLLVPRAKVLKYLSSSSLASQASNQPAIQEGFLFECWNCQAKTLSPLCSRCKKQLLKCTLCRLPVKGMANLCVKCGHGGHSSHLAYWFEKSDVCAGGCGCYCLLEESNFY